MESFIILSCLIHSCRKETTEVRQHLILIVSGVTSSVKTESYALKTLLIHSFHNQVKAQKEQDTWH